MILPISYDDLAETWSLSGHNDSLTAMFVDMVVLIHMNAMVAAERT